MGIRAEEISSLIKTQIERYKAGCLTSCKIG
jgi:hypothetical protein